MKRTRRVVTPAKVKNRLRQAFHRHLGIGVTTAGALLQGAKLYDKAYELSSMLETLDRLRGHIPLLAFRLMQGSNLIFRGKGGPINRGKWPFIQVMHGTQVVAEIWIDIECLALSAHHSNAKMQGYPYGKAHELDVVIVKPGVSGYPTPYDIFLGVEAKHRSFNKALLKELLGVRREMTFRGQAATANPFVWWSTGRFPADPPSGLVAFCSNPNVGKYDDPAAFWGIEMIYHRC